jgi:hypothetical protein
MTIFCFSYTAAQQLQCAKFECGESGDNTCAIERSGVKTVGYNNVTFSNVCPDDLKCEVDRYIYQDLSEYDRDFIFKCNRIIPTLPRYPGEDCSTDKDCYVTESTTGKCVEGKCSGTKMGERCIDSLECLVGLYCQGAKCMPQQQLGEKCYKSADCANNLLCNNSTCSVKPYSLPLGSEITTYDGAADNYCQLGYAKSLTYNTFFCTSMNQTWSEDYRKCNYGDSCQYVIPGSDNYTMPCSCGFNPDQQGYCPQGKNISNIWL